MMTAIVSLLRGINVGGHNKIKMTELVDLYRSLHLAKPQTHIQSGNVIFGATEKHLEALARRIAGAIETKFQVKSEVILRTVTELEAVIARNPFAGRTDVEPAKLAVFFLSGDPAAEAPASLEKFSSAPEEFHLDRRHLYAYFPNGMGQSTIPQAKIERALKVPATARNWNTVRKLYELASQWSA
jgi:uncharacterized protein (DUF1697 family)